MFKGIAIRENKTAVHASNNLASPDCLDFQNRNIPNHVQDTLAFQNRSICDFSTSVLRRLTDSDFVDSNGQSQTTPQVPFITIDGVRFTVA